jgi:hypothetical protein
VTTIGSRTGAVLHRGHTQRSWRWMPREQPESGGSVAPLQEALAVMNGEPNTVLKVRGVPQ